MRVLVTGGAGFIGATMAIGLAERHPDWDIAALDNLMNSGSVDIQQARAFCGIVGENYRTACLDRIGGDLRYLATQTEQDSYRQGEPLH